MSHSKTEGFDAMCFKCHHYAHHHLTRHASPLRRGCRRYVLGYRCGCAALVDSDASGAGPA